MNKGVKTAAIAGGSLLALAVIFGAALGGRDSGEPVSYTEAEPTAVVERFSPDEFTQAEDLTIETTVEGTVTATVTGTTAQSTTTATTTTAGTTAASPTAPAAAVPSTTAPKNTTAPAAYDEEAERDYILNTNTKKFHRPDCASVKEMKDKNKQTFHGTRNEVIEKGYDPCGRCHP
ncbi:MAG: hypothetical protein II702_01425 [Clostridia bacterium]|nr:hypothetical protein [Clostridia bacterium]